ncbi:MAG: immunoglobulin-like domain-containing protein [Erysipelotrichaceae bacterium]
MGKKLSKWFLALLIVGGHLASAPSAMAITKGNLENTIEWEELKRLEQEKNESYGSIGTPLYVGACVDASKPYELANALSATGSYETIACYATLAEAQSAMTQQPISEVKVATILKSGTVVDTAAGLLNLQAKATANAYYNLYGSATTTSVNNYTHGLYGGDAAYMGSSGSRSRLMISDYTGWINTSDVLITPISFVKGASYYTVNSAGTLVHTLSNNILTTSYSTSWTQGPAPTYLAKNVKYYSFDGHYFYTSLLTMVQDYKAGHNKNAVNPNSPFYNYYQFLSHRTFSKMAPADLKNLFEVQRGYTQKPLNSDSSSNLAANKSQLYGEHNNFISYQNRYGVNALLALGVAINESAWGRSSIAISKNNLFGHAAYDSSPGTSSSMYSSVAKSIEYHMFGFVSQGYLDRDDYAGRYYGPHLGNKGSGLNVKYASDPYWGEKAAHYYHYVDQMYGYPDYATQTIGVYNSTQTVNVRKEANTTQPILYNNKGLKNSPVVILGKVNGESVNGNTLWYRIASDMPLVADRSKTNWEIEYNANISYGYVHSSLINVVSYDQAPVIPDLDALPTITASNKTFKVGDVITTAMLMEGVSAFDPENGDLTSQIKIIENTINPNVVGTYKVVYQVSDSANHVVTKEVTITIRSNTLPTISASNKAYGINTQITNALLLEGVVAHDSEDGDLTSKVTIIENTINSTSYGTYYVTYQVIDADNNKTTLRVEVNITDNTAPTITANAFTLTLGTTLTNNVLLQGVSAKDNEDGDLTSALTIKSHTINPSITGTYQIVYEVKDRGGLSATKSVSVKVVSNTASLKEIPGNFYFEGWTMNNNVVDFKGYLVLNNTQNRWSDPLRYEIIFTNVQTKAQTTMVLDRWTTTSQHPFTIPGENGYTYSGAWFKGTLDLSVLPQGDYTAQVRASNGTSKTTASVRNLFSKPQSASYTDANGKGYWFRNNYYLKSVPMEIFIRDQGLLAPKNVSAVDNMFNSYTKLELNNNSLRIRGTSFNVGGDYSGSVKRSIVLENQATFERFYYGNVGYVDNGDYEVSLRVPDGKSKKRAWFDTQIDLSNVPAGTYTIYVASEAGSVRDVAELNDAFMKPLNVTSGRYTVKLNTDKRMRVELIVK